MVLFGSLGFGSLAFGLIGDHAGVLAALIIAAVAMALGAASIRRWPFRDVSATDRTPWSWPEAQLAPGPPTTSEAVMVTVTYSVRPGDEREFIAGIEDMRQARLSTGAVQWGLFRDAEAPQQFTELFVVDSWEEHLRQHRERQTAAERQIEARVHAYSPSGAHPARRRAVAEAPQD